jgi:uncharacterized protein
MKARWILILAIFFTVGCGSQEPTIDIWKAVSTGNIDEVQKHIAVKTDLNGKEPLGGGTLLMTSVVINNIKVAKLLVKNGADLEAKNNDGSTALMTAVFFCHPDIVTLLLDNGAQVNSKNKNGQTSMDVVAGEWSKDLEGIYKLVGGLLKMQIDLERVKKVRPEVAAILIKHGGKISSAL